MRPVADRGSDTSTAMIELSRGAVALIALLCGGWLVLAAWLSLAALGRLRMARISLAERDRAEAFLSASPALPMLVGRSTRVEGPETLYGLLRLSAPPHKLADALVSLEPDDAARLTEAVAATAAGGAPFALAVRKQQSARVFQVRGAPAPPPHPAGTVLLWFLDATESEEQMNVLLSELARVSGALDALSMMIEAAPFPVWHRGPDLRLSMVNTAYVDAVEADDAMTVITDGIELVDEIDARSALDQAAAVRAKGEAVSRTVPATIAGERRMVRVVEVPLGDSGIAGYAIDVEDREQARADLARFVSAQRDMLDRLSAGVAQFARDRSLTFFNQPFVRLFSLRAEWLADRPEFDRVIDRMRESGHLPEVRDFPEWKGEKRGWFTGGLAADEEDWLLPGGKHLRVVAQPLPDGGLLLIFEDRTEQ